VSNAEKDAFGIRDGDLLVCEGGEPGRAAVWDKGPTPLTFQKALMRIRPKSGVEPRYLAGFLRHTTLAGDLERHFTGTTIKHLPQNKLRGLELPLPPLAEQQRIVAKLDAVTARTARARADLDRAAVLADKQRRALLGRLFAKGWPEVALGDVATDVRYGTAAKCSYEPKATPVLRIPNVAKGRIDTADLKFAS